MLPQGTATTRPAAAVQSAAKASTAPGSATQLVLWQLQASLRKCHAQHAHSEIPLLGRSRRIPGRVWRRNGQQGRVMLAAAAATLSCARCSGRRCVEGG